MITIFRKLILGVLIAALAIASLPLTSAYAAGSNGTATPPAPGTPKNSAAVKVRLELAFARQQYNVQRINLAIDNADILVNQVQKLIDKATQNGKDTSALQTAFAAYKAAIQTGNPLFEQAKTIAATHDGFDASGKVTDTEKAKATLKSLNDALKQYHEAIGKARQTLREAVKAFQTANPRTPKTTPTAP